ASGATISSLGTAGAAIYTVGGAANVTNSGNISATDHGILIDAGGTVSNTSSGSITAQNAGVFIKNVPGTVINSGHVSGTGTNGAGVYLENNGNVTNASTGTITGAFFGAFIEGGAGSLSNSGSISGATYDGVVLGLGGVVTNSAGGKVTGGSTGIYVKYRAVGTVTNSGGISGSSTNSAGVDLAGGGTLTNNVGGSITGSSIGVFVGSSSTLATLSMIGTISNAGNIAGGKYDGVALSKGGTVTNLSGGSISGGSNGIYVNKGSSGTVTNTGSITATVTSGAGVDLGGGGSVNNNAGGVIAGGGFGVFATGSLGSVTNTGSISGAHGVSFGAGGSVTNNASASISGQLAGVQVLGAPGTLVNTGQVTASAGAGADIELGGSVTNQAGGTITGSTFGVFITGGSSTVTNAGTISGSTYAVDFTGSATNRLIVEPGAVFVGKVGANGASANTLELASGTGSIGGLGGGGSSFGNFQTLVIDAGGNWTLTGANATTGVLDAGAIDIVGTLSASAITFQGTSELLIDNASTFGSNVGSSSYTGPQLQDFIAGDQIDLKNFSSAGATLSYNSATGLLQVSNAANQLASLSFQTSSLGSGTFNAVGDGANGTFISLGTSVTPPTISVENDFNGDGKSDALWRNSSSGEVVDWTMNGPQISLAGDVTYQGNPVAPDASWSVAGIGDFNGDRMSDVLWRNNSGEVVDWTMNGSQIASAGDVTYQGSPVARDATWSVSGIGDFNGDGMADVLWRNSSGEVVDWTMNGSQIASAGDVTYQGSPIAPDSSWSVVGLGDFNGDGKTDVLWRNSSSGEVTDWTMNGSQITSGGDVTYQGSPVAPDATWSVAGIGDFNGDGMADILWRNSNGTLSDWTMNGSQVTSEQNVTFQGAPATPDASWQIAEIGDFNGDGKSDILWRNTNGALSDWTMNGSQVVSEQSVTYQGSPTTPDNTWNLQAKPTDFA
ncbi:MAG: FG-GAP repeat protein, partial [Hyphomicrobiales bacterium]|nr:FG-GAP repeat protein [Hyphomicrobiales bacterium]